MPYNRFYSTVYQNFRDGKYDDGLRGLAGYKVYITTSASFRKIYNQLITVLDKIIESSPMQKSQSGSTTSGVSMTQLTRPLVRLNILLEYQKKRRVIDDDLADGIKQALDEIRANLNNPDNAVKYATALRDSLDAFLAYVIYGMKGRGEEEYGY